MVKIKNGVNEFIVTSGAAKIYKNQGYKVVDDSTNKVENASVDKTMTDSEKFCEEMSEKPISQWTQEELKKFTDIKKIDISSAKKVSEVKEIVKRYLDNH